MKKSPQKISQAVQAIIVFALYLFTLPCFGGDFLWKSSDTSFAYVEHLEWQKSFQWNRKQAFQTYKRQYRHDLKQRKAWLQERLRNQDRDHMERQQSELKKEWDAEQRAYQITRLRITRKYIKNRNRHRKQKPGSFSPKRTQHSREFVL